MNRRCFVGRTMAAGVIAFIPVHALETISRSGNVNQFNDELMNTNDIIPAPDDHDKWEDWRRF